MSTKAYRDGWERVFGPRTPVEMISNPFMLRHDLSIRYEIPRDFALRDLRRLVRHLATMCDDWEPEHGFPVLAWPEREKPELRVIEGGGE